MCKQRMTVGESEFFTTKSVVFEDNKTLEGEMCGGGGVWSHEDGMMEDLIESQMTRKKQRERVIKRLTAVCSLLLKSFSFVN